MTHEDDRFSEFLRSASRDYNKPPELSHTDLDDMWSRIERDAALRGTERPRLLGRERPRAFGGHPADSRQPRWFSTRTLTSLAAMLLVGVAIGRSTVSRSPVPAQVVAGQPAAADTTSMPEPYQSTTSRYLGQTAALLVALPGEVRAGRADGRFLDRAHDLLLTTRLLMDSPAAADPRLHTLLEDLELVLAQVVRLQTDQSRAELDLIRQALDERDVLPRLRTAVADISAD